MPKVKIGDMADPLPPHARGWLPKFVVDADEKDSAPACAGLTVSRSPRAPRERLYPRVRGAARLNAYPGQSENPLPPRARG